MTEKTCVIIAGPTAVGKTAAAIAVARHFNTAVISADSRQCFKEMTIGVAKPSHSELQQVHHYFINSHSIHDDVNAAVFEQYALQAADEIFQQHDLAVVTGGTGLYIKAFCEGLDDMPPVSINIRQAITAQYERAGLAWLQQQVQEQDPLYYATGEVQNPQRLIRALEVKQATGESIRTFQQGKKAARPFRIIKLGLELPKPELHARINTRVDQMMEQGLLNEVKQLVPYKQLNALQTVGYSELFEYLDGKITLQQAIDQIKTNTRQYAKRQMTWFKRDANMQWFSPDAVENIVEKVVN
ncbi:tRNA (adenosine(37)-N6)-dimethylallyltransferase MiaA [Niastella populi]|uniref:tRNA dimethylallyltransferase n=1 Tax=Niastella populi TaxID=550983 RepID=A0A1V9G1R0_9BACT|nr:tRNA (adenosine(37)-N6)-dimethylallyltransferase MiaA [Niastella populi]OQP64579.1 tRNA (adenosine(37)-N6)-dimethylallyltransferase MiaA [Niastella populi]